MERTVVCGNCGTSFRTTKNNRKFCDLACTQEHQYRRHHAHDRYWATDEEHEGSVLRAMGGMPADVVDEWIFEFYVTEMCARMRRHHVHRSDEANIPTEDKYEAIRRESGKSDRHYGRTLIWSAGEP